MINQFSEAIERGGAGLPTNKEAVIGFIEMNDNRFFFVLLQCLCISANQEDNSSKSLKRIFSM